MQVFSMKQFSVAIVDSNQLFREGLRQLLEQGHLSVLTTVKTLAEMVDVMSSLEVPDLVILGASSAEEIEQLAVAVEALRGASADLRLVLLTNTANFHQTPRSISERVDAFLSKDISSEVLQRSLELVMLGQKIFPPSLGRDAFNDQAEKPKPFRITSHIGTRAPSAEVIHLANHKSASQLDPTAAQPSRVVLSVREDQILCRLVDGLSNKVIARDLHITEATVKAHMKGLLQKIRVRNRTQAAIWALNNGLTDDSTSGDGDPTT
jgi:two-component system, NarL family, nitrate/nitrite response regulator NarL